MDYTILTFPRCGSNYLHQLITRRLRDPNNLNEKIDLLKTHVISEVKTNKVISIIRSPYETMNSLVTLVLTFPDKLKVIDPSVKSGKILIDGQEIDAFNESIYRFPHNDYIEIYKYMINNENILIDYNDLISRPDEVMSFLAKKLNLEFLNSPYINYLFDNKEHLVSSTSSPLYNKINYSKHSPGHFNMLECKYQYNKALKECILK